MKFCVLSPNNLGDLSLHLNLIRYLSTGVSFWPESSILSDAPLSYPLGADLFNSLLEVCGVETIRGLVWTGLAGAALTGYALWLWGGAFGIAALLFNGGLAGFAVLRTLQIEDFQREIVWKNLFLSMFVTQRGLLFALPAGLFLLNVWRERYFRGTNRSVPFWLQVLLYASMPLFNVHAFLFLSFVLVAIFVDFVLQCALRAPGTTGRRPGCGTISEITQSHCKQGCPRGDGSGRVGRSSCDGRHPSRYGIFLGFLGNPLAPRLDRSGGGLEPLGLDLEFWPDPASLPWCWRWHFSSTEILRHAVLSGRQALFSRYAASSYLPPGNGTI